MRVAEPATVLTDYAIALQCAVFALWLWRSRTPSAQLWSVGFGAIALGAVAGGTFHGFRAALSVPVGVMLWQMTLSTIGLASFAIGLGTVVVSMRQRWQLIWAIVFVLKALIFGILTSTTLTFSYAIADYSVTLVLLLLFQGAIALRYRAPALKWLGIGVAISGVAAWGLARNLGFGSVVSPEAVFHLIQMGGLYCLYRAACILSQEQQKSPTETAGD